MWTAHNRQEGIFRFLLCVHWGFVNVPTQWNQGSTHSYLLPQSSVGLFLSLYILHPSFDILFSFYCFSSSPVCYVLSRVFLVLSLSTAFSKHQLKMYRVQNSALFSLSIFSVLQYFLARRIRYIFVFGKPEKNVETIFHVVVWCRWLSFSLHYNA